MLVGQSCSQPLERRGAFILFVYVYVSLSQPYLSNTGADARTGYVYCSECDNFIYESALNNVFVSTALNAEEKHTRFQG
jgi:hypothetical protein